ncbi:hypothetical protein [Herpetosiphon llansteffanensis]|uniref:hypothetical protein n=1 Tax=Herpetosiphon llansteffanensis TaxID=2094568 RepID=UPI000D7BF722|nr:hypothetical protein [Herpetosiphon llansteffanensis]
MIKHWMRPMLGGLLLLLASCGQPDRAPTNVQPLAPIANSGAQTAQPTATYEDPFAWVIDTPPADAIARVTAEAAHDLAIIHFEETMQSLPSADPMGPAKTYESLPTRVMPTWIRLGDECESDNGDMTFETSNCWAARIDNETISIHISAGRESPQAVGSIRLIIYPIVDRFQRKVVLYYAPQTTNVLSLTAVAYPLVDLQSDNGLPFRFNLETHQWLDGNGTPIPLTPTP